MTLLNTINGGMYVPVAFIQGIHTSDNTANVREVTSFLFLMLTTSQFLCCTVVIPVLSTLNILWTG